jgi:hypothetical protein
MRDTTLSVSYESLGNILEQLQESPEVKASLELTERVRNAILFHRQVSTEWQELLREHRELLGKISDLTREPGERVCNQSPPGQFIKYEEMRNHGADTQEVYLATKSDGLDDIGSLKALRQVFNLSLPEAQEAISQAEIELSQQAA